MTILPDNNCCLTVEISDEDYSSTDDEFDPLFLDFLKSTGGAVEVCSYKKQKKNVENVKTNNEKDNNIYEDYGNEESFKDVVENPVRNNYKEKQANLFCAWKKALPEIVQAYIDFLGSNPLDSSPCTCPLTERKSGRLNLFSWDVVQEDQVFEYCKCSNLTVALAKAGMFPLSPVNPSGAVHFELCKVLVNLRNVFAGSGEKIAEFMSIQHSDSQKCLSAENCSNVILLFNKMVELAENTI
ncbi:hypothetical protein G6F56_007298 [Rhizopus delemar]|nr:hypothetical protein G6F56_007298 [Rhizopus delemar]